MACSTENTKIDIKRIEEQLDEAKRAMIDKSYVDYPQGKGHLFDYKIDFNSFLEDIQHILSEVKKA